mmetsp:Transcript_13145/g.27002  ORF Transcript_13145/g.27002 Transcript_13145/m.27002 type:complete len:813 (+) Transcript_13145:71-2509(+)
MVRVFIKGGVWKNSEDEILKAAVMKYGKQNWDRVASLLNRKSGKQCKARWFEWLDPSVKKVEWSREEEEKLLHLAKLMPAQWRTIAPIVGRTAAQCQEKYELLLDAAATRESGGDGAPDESSASTTSGQRGVRVGEIDTQPETKPARPDPIDMDDDEVEMLQEARARLANTQGKKAKRKGREKMLAEAKRLADLQKRRELKAAGIISGKARTGGRKRKGEIDYGVEIPFHKPAPAGFHDVASEVERTDEIQRDRMKDIDFGKVNEQNMKSRDKEQAEAKKKEKQRIKALEKANMQLVVNHVSKQNDPLSYRERGTLSMPAPAVSDRELEAVAKMSSAMMPPPPPRGKGNQATNALLGDYTDRPLPTPMRTPVGQQGRSDVIMQEAANARAMNMQTPLRGDENPELLGGTGYEGAEPKGRVTGGTAASTMGGSVSVKTGGGRGDVSVLTSASGVTNATPGGPRDHFGLNAPSSVAGGGGGGDFDDTASLSSFASSVRSSAREHRRAAKKARLDLANALAALPKPQFEYEIAAPEIEEEEEDGDGKVEMEEDQEDVQRRLEEIKRLEAEVEFASRSSVMKRKEELPAPGWEFVESAVDAADADVRQEMLRLLRHDAAKHGGPAKKGTKRKLGGGAADLEHIPLKDLEAARALLEKEGEAKMQRDANRLGIDVDELASVIAKENEKDTSSMVYTGEERGWVENAGKKDIVAALKYEYGRIEEAAAVLEKKKAKLGKKLQVKMGGYAKKAESLRQAISDSYESAANAEIEVAVYERLRDMEGKVLGTRLKKLKAEVVELEATQTRLQAEWSELHSS